MIERRMELLLIQKALNLPKYKQHDYEFGSYGNHSEDEGGLIYHGKKETGVDVHHDYKRSLEKINRT